MATILKELKTHIPDSKLSDAGFEGANIVIYTKDKDFFNDDKGLIRKLVSEFKKRIELRPDPAISMEMEKAKKAILKIIPEEAEVDQIIFDPQRSIVVIEAKKPGLVIGKSGSILNDIKSKTLWIPQIKRTPAIHSPLIEDLRSLIYQSSEYRKEFLNKTGHRIYDGWIRGRKNEWVRMTMLGAGRQVGRSAILLQTPESRILLDCGIDVASSEKYAYPYLDVPEFNISELDAVIITHSHLDHVGFLPYLFKYGYRGPVYCTLPTRDVMTLSLIDYVKIQHQETKAPLFTMDDVREMVKHIITLDFEEVSDVTPDIRLTFYISGHILGSAMAHLHIGNGLHNLLYTGDLKYGETSLLDAAATKFPRLETLIIEGTYGDKDKIMPPKREADEALKEIIKTTVKRGGKLLMPVLASGRAQEVMIMLESMIRNKEIPEMPIYIDGLVWDVTAIHTAYPEFLNKKIRNLIFNKDTNPFLSKSFIRVGSAKERVKIIESEGPCAILATSGMMVGGPSVEYFKNLANDEKHSLIFTCYQGAGSLGKRIQNGEKELIIGEGSKKENVKVKMEIHKLEITGHSDRLQLMNFVRNIRPTPRKVIVNHGESRGLISLASSIHKIYHIETKAPHNLETIRLV